MVFGGQQQLLPAQERVDGMEVEVLSDLLVKSVEDGPADPFRNWAPWSGQREDSGKCPN